MFSIKNPVGSMYVITQTFDEHIAYRAAANLKNYNGGVDYATPMRTPVYPACSGVVRAVGDFGNIGYGKYIRIAHIDGFETVYAHLDEIVVRVGESVNECKIVGYTGNTGFTTGPHIHFELRLGGVPVDPLMYMAAVPQSNDNIQVVRENVGLRSVNVQSKEGLRVRTTPRTDTWDNVIGLVEFGLHDDMFVIGTVEMCDGSTWFEIGYREFICSKTPENTVLAEAI